MTRSYFVRALLAAVLACVGVGSVQAAAQDAAAAKAPCMKILLVGASGMIGSRILDEAVSRGHCVIGAARHPEKIAKKANVTAVQLDATDAKAFTALAAQADVIVTATSPRGGGDPIAEAKAVNDAAMAAAKANGKRIVVVGGAGSLNLPNGSPLAETLPAEYRGEALAMRGVRDALKKSDLDWTFFSPAATIAPGKRTGKYQLGTTTLLSDAKGESRISAEDFAHALVSELETHKHPRQQMTIAY